LSNSHKRDLTKGPVYRALVAMSAPMSLGIFSVIAVGLADAYFFGPLITSTAIAELIMACADFLFHYSHANVEFTKIYR